MTLSLADSRARSENAMCCSVHQCVALCYNQLHCVVVCCSVLQCVAMRCCVEFLGSTCTLLLSSCNRSRLLIAFVREPLSSNVALGALEQNYNKIPEQD